MGTVGAPADGPTADSTPRAMVARGVSKAFGGTRALEDFTIDLEEGEVHALVGGNGSGKSTFIKVLAGVHRADSGEIERSGSVESLTTSTPARARARGLRFVHQDLGIFPSLSVTENLAIGNSFITTRAGRIRWRASRAAAKKTLERFHVDADPGAQAGTLSTPQRALLAIARALQSIDERDRAILVLDEPTASLPPEEATLLLSSVRTLAGQGHSVLLVTHRLDEVRRAADRVTALRDGRNAGTMEAQSMTESDAVQLVLGRQLDGAVRRSVANAASAPILTVQNLKGGPLRDVSLRVAPGEVVGVAGLLGSGRTELLEMLFGVRPYEAGAIAFEGMPVPTPTPSLMRGLGLAFVPEDRQREAVFGNQDIAENMTAGRVASHFRAGLLRDGQLRRGVRTDIDRFHVKAGSDRARIETLSGGNQQKVILARWMRDRPKLVLLDEPTQGIDVGAREEILSLINRATEEGAGVVLVTSEFEELVRLSDRVIVLSSGTIADQLPGGRSSQDVLRATLEHAGSGST